MTDAEAKKIGSRQGLIYSGLGVLIAQLIITVIISSDTNFFKAFFWFISVNYKFNLLIGVIVLLLCGYFYGQIAGKAIIVQKRNFVLVGFLCGMAVLLTTAFLSGWAGFFQEGIHNLGTNDNPFEDYIFKPLFWISVFGCIPAVIVGLFFGWQIKLKSKMKTHEHTTYHWRNGG